MYKYPLNKILLSILCFIFISASINTYAETALSTISSIYNQLKNYDDAKPGSAKIKAKIDTYWLYTEISMDAIQDQWNKMSKNQQTRYIALMRKLLEKTIYEDTGDKLKKGTAKVVKQQNLSSTSATVKTKITVKKNNNTVSNDYTLNKIGNEWKIRIIFIDGSNLAEDYRSQYNQIVQKYGIEGNKNALLERIKASLTKDDFYNISDDKKNSKKPTATDSTLERPSLLD